MKHTRAFWMAMGAQFLMWVTLCWYADLKFGTSVLFLMALFVSEHLGAVRATEELTGKEKVIEEPKL
jgi:hypothetical protein